nr:hypothetical protein [uncultured Cohaesibacter sp.]
MKRNNKITLCLSAACFALVTFAAQAMTQDEAISAATEKLKLTDVSLDYRDFYGQNLRAALPDGTWVEIHLNRDGQINEIEGHRKRGFPEQSVRILIPAEILQNPSYPSGTYFQKLDFKDGYKVEIEGYCPDSHEFKAEFRHDGKLLEMKKEK